MKRPAPMPRWWRLSMRAQGLFFLTAASTGLVALTTESLGWAVLTAFAVGTLAALSLWATGRRKDRLAPLKQSSR